MYAGEYLKRLKPDILVGGHSFVMDRPAAFIERYRRWSYEMRDAFRELSSEEDYRYWFDPFWVRAQPYRLVVRPGESVGVTLHLRNFQRGRQRFRIEPHLPAGFAAEVPAFEGTVEGESRKQLPFRLKAMPSTRPGVHIVAFDVTLDGRRYGERFDLIVSVESAPPAPLRGVRSD